MGLLPFVVTDLGADDSFECDDVSEAKGVYAAEEVRLSTINRFNGPSVSG